MAEGDRRGGPERFVVGIYVAARLLSSFGKKAGYFADTNLYLEFRSFDTRRPWTVAWLFDLLDGHNHTRIIWAQVLIACACWSVLALVMAARCAPPARPWIAGAVVVLASSVQVAEWDYLLLSESLAISLLALWVAAVIRWIQPGPAHAGSWSSAVRRAAPVALVGWLWTQTRETNSFSAIVVVVMIGAVRFFRSRPEARRAAVAVVVACGFALGSSWMLSTHTNSLPYLDPAPPDAKHRSITLANYRFMDVFGKRILFDPKAVAWFDRQGMPQFPGRNELRDFSAADRDYQMYDNAEFVRWVDRHGQGAYARWLLSRPWWSIRFPFKASNELLAPQVDYYFAHIRRHLPEAIEQPIWPAQPGFVLEVIAVVLAVAVAAAWRRRRYGLGDSDLWPVGTALLAGSFAALIGTWHGAWLEAARHNIVNNVSIRISLIVLAASACRGNPRNEGDVGDTVRE